MIKAIIFDVDGVLLDSFEANLQFYNSLIKTTGYTPPTREEYEDRKMNHLTMEDVIKKVTKLKNKKEIKRIWTMGKYEIDYPRHKIKVQKGIKALIKKLKEMYILGIVTSRVKGGLFKIKGIDILKKYFETVIYYEDTKEHKPHPEPLLLAAKKLGITPSECIYIGDAESDIQAAKSARMKIISYPKKLKGADASTSDFETLPKLIASLK